MDTEQEVTDSVHEPVGNDPHGRPAPSESRNGIQVIARAAAILRALREDNSGLSLGQIAERVRLPRSTVQRIVGALQTERLVIATGEIGSIRLGPELMSLSEAARYSIVEECRPLLVELSQTLGETADLSVLRRDGMIFLDQVPGTQRLRTVSAIGEVFPLTCTANGRAALAKLPPEEARELALREWKTKEPDEARWQALARKLEEVRETGLAADLDEHTTGISALGCAFRNHAGEIYALSVPVPSGRFARMRPAIEKELRKVHQRIESLIAA